jgi:hypothetical protein
MRLVYILALTLALGACNTISSLHYATPNPIQTSPSPSISAATATDQRRESPTRLATIMGGFGNPLKTLDTAKPVKDEVADAFTEGLRVRGLLVLGDRAPYRLTLVLRKFDADMIIGRTARIDLTMSVIDHSGRIIFQDSTADSVSDFKFFQTGVFADIGDMRVLSEAVLSRAVDRMLDAPAFRAAVTPIPGGAS